MQIILFAYIARAERGGVTLKHAVTRTRTERERERERRAAACAIKRYHDDVDNLDLGCWRIKKRPEEIITAASAIFFVSVFLDSFRHAAEVADNRTLT